MTENSQNLEHKIETKKLTIKQLELQMKRLELQQAKAKDKLAKQIEREKLKEQKIFARKQRNRQIYNWGGLIPMVLGVENFDQIADDPDLKKVLIGLLLKTQAELQANGFGLTSENKPKWLEFYKNQGKKFLDEQNHDNNR